MTRVDLATTEQLGAIEERVAVSPAQFGGDSSGTGDSLAAIHAALATGRPVDLGGPENTWRVTDRILLDRDYAHVDSRGATVVLDAPAGADLSTQFAVIAQGATSGAAAAATGAVATTSRAMPFPTTGLAPGDKVHVASSTQLYMDGVTGAPELREELLCVETVDGAGQWTATEFPRFNYASGATTTAQKIDMLKGVYWNANVLGGGTGMVHNGVLFSMCETPTFGGVVDGCEDTGVQWSRCWGGDVLPQAFALNCTSPDPLIGTTGYGFVAVDASRGIRAPRFWGARNCRHAVASGSCAADLKFHFGQLDGNGIGSGATLDCHEATFDVEFAFNMITGAKSSAIGLRGQGAKALYNIGRGIGSHGVHAKSFDANTDGLLGIQIIGNDMRQTGGAGARVEGTTTCRVVGAEVHGNTFMENGLNNLAALRTDGLEIGPNVYDTPQGSGNDGNNVRLVGTGGSDVNTDVNLRGGRFSSAPLRWIKADFVDGLTVDGAYVMDQVNNTMITSCTRTKVKNVTGPAVPADFAVTTPNSNFTLTPMVDPEQQLHQGTLTAIRTATLRLTQNMHLEARFRIVRTGGGAPTLDVLNGTAGPILKSLATNTWGEFRFDGTNWIMIGAGTL